MEAPQGRHPTGSDPRSNLPRQHPGHVAPDGIPDAVARHDTPWLFDRLIGAAQQQGISDANAGAYTAKHGIVGWHDIRSALDGSPACHRLRSFTESEAALATKAAELMGLRPLPVRTDSERALAAQVPRGRVFATGRGKRTDPSGPGSPSEAAEGHRHRFDEAALRLGWHPGRVDRAWGRVARQSR